MSLATTPPIVDFHSRFGKPRIQRYKVSDSLRLSVEYRVGGMVSAVEIAPSQYRGYNPSQPLEMSSQTADEILENLIPGVTCDGIPRETVIQTTYPGFSREVRHLPGASLNRDYPMGIDRSKMIAASLAVSSADLTESLRGVISPLGAAEYEQFGSDSGLGVGVLYDSEGLILQIRILADEPLLVHSDYAKSIEPDAAELLLDELVPPSLRDGTPRRSVFRSGGLTREHCFYNQIALCRSYVNGEMIGVDVSWP